MSYRYWACSLPCFYFQAAMRKTMERTLYKQRISILSPVLLYYLTNNLLNLMKQESNKVSNKNVADKVHNIKHKIYIGNNKNTSLNNISKTRKNGPPISSHSRKILIDIEVENNSWLWMLRSFKLLESFPSFKIRQQSMCLTKLMEAKSSQFVCNQT